MNKVQKILFIIEDDKFFNTLLANYLKIKGFQVYAFMSGEECLEKKEVTPDIILLDYLLPGINGLDVMKKLKPLYPNTEFIFVSGQGEIKVALDAMHEGAYDYIIKDHHAKETVLNKIDQIIRFRKISREREMYRKSVFIIVAVLVLSWIGLLSYYFLR
jgi:FixJ family two-component response regulator